VGAYPVEAVAVMDRIALASSRISDYRHETPQASDEPTIDQAMSNAACDVAEALSAKAILVPTFTGRTGLAVARLRPQRAILALTHKMESLRHMALEWGVTPLDISETTDVEDLWTRSIAGRAGVGHRPPRRAARDHRRHRRQHPRRDERHQGRRRVGKRPADAELLAMAGKGKRKERKRRRPRAPRWLLPVIVLGVVGFLYVRPDHDLPRDPQPARRTSRRGRSRSAPSARA
jgi:hypothetical protein